MRGVFQLLLSSKLCTDLQTLWQISNIFIDFPTLKHLTVRTLSRYITLCSVRWIQDSCADLFIKCKARVRSPEDKQEWFMENQRSNKQPKNYRLIERQKVQTQEDKPMVMLRITTPGLTRLHKESFVVQWPISIHPFIHSFSKPHVLCRVAGMLEPNS